jgi:hypothetical protein
MGGICQKLNPNEVTLVSRKRRKRTGHKDILDFLAFDLSYGFHVVQVGSYFGERGKEDVNFKRAFKDQQR